MAYRRLAVVLALVAMTIAGVDGPVAAAEADRFQLNMARDGDCIGVNGPPRTKGLFSVRTPGGRLRATRRFNTRALGQHVLCLGIGGIHGGDRLRIQADDGWQRRWRVPHIRVRIDRARDVVSGSTDAGRSVAVETWELLPFMEGVGAPRGPFTPEMEADGAYRLDLADTMDLQGNDVVIVESHRRGLSVSAIVAVPYVVVHAASDAIDGAGPTDEIVSVRLVRDGTVRGVATAASEPTGTFAATFRDERGDAVYPRPGDRLVMDIPGGPAFRIPPAWLRADARSDIVRGRCLPDARFKLRLGDGVSVRGRTGSDGRLQRDVTDTLDLEVGAALQLICLTQQADQLEVLVRAE